MAVEIISAIAWPLVAVVGVVALWRSGFMGEVGRRTTRISVFQVSLELATASPGELPGLEKLRDPVSSQEFQSGEKSLMQQLLQPDDIDYAVIDLRDGQRWLASRLFLFAELLRRQRGLRCIVFVEHRDSIGRRLVGLADPVDVKWALAARYPWLESALNDACTQAFMLAALPISLSRSGRLEPEVAEQVAANFLGHPNISWTDGTSLPYPWGNVFVTAGSPPAPWVRAGAQPLPASPAPEWAIVHEQPTRYEHTKWLTGSILADIMGVGLLREDDWIMAEPGADEEEQVLEVLSRSGDFVAAVNTDRSFRRLIERRLVLEEVARREVRRARQASR
jgi:hypothetical protein